jgi:hypothetical protein
VVRSILRCSTVSVIVLVLWRCVGVMVVSLRVNEIVVRLVCRYFLNYKVAMFFTDS